MVSDLLQISPHVRVEKNFIDKLFKVCEKIQGGAALFMYTIEVRLKKGCCWADSYLLGIQTRVGIVSS